MKCLGIKASAFAAMCAEKESITTDLCAAMERPCAWDAHFRKSVIISRFFELWKIQARTFYLNYEPVSEVIGPSFHAESIGTLFLFVLNEKQAVTGGPEI